ncbi:hypothetical protein AWH56_006885 [Anaerobacillus isosaccharinicus]|uniref:Uncharacterized protein n=1 Tax=Anaerobacillus isosaccharinicus TaxID=1532552 RepID=A0A1S2MFL3_9BACI|nr:hypothetical protein [Anaerobacillus isosaccharinicus]MBA5584252.1 hypothetical protein [Anaerobacillus isosaccharinicus]QOY37347.1 hypothetical protein AWH56_006885 [Anaerobacillus isosaccharinicus]
MIDTIKFDIPVHLSEDEINNIKWTKTNTTVSKKNRTRPTAFHFIYDEQRIGDPHILYVYKQDEPSKSWLKVEVSVPKFMYGNNLKEIDHRDLQSFMSLLRKHIADKLNLTLPRIPSLWTTEIEKLHLCKNFYVGNLKQQYLQALSKAKKARHKKQIYYQSGTENVESVYWKTNSRTEKVYDKDAEMASNKKENSQPQKTKGTIRYEVELSNYELRKLSNKRIADEVLNFSSLEKILGGYLDNLGISQSRSVDTVMKAIKVSTLNQKQKQHLIQFAKAFFVEGELCCRTLYSRSKFYELKKELETLLGVSSLLITEKSLHPLEIKKETVQ